MAQLSLGEGRWRMLRRVVKAKRFRFEDCRNMSRQDQDHFDWLLENGFLAPAGGGTFELTERGRAAADLGMYDWEPARAATPPAGRRGRPGPAGA